MPFMELYYMCMKMENNSQVVL